MIWACGGGRGKNPIFRRSLRWGGGPGPMAPGWARRPRARPGARPGARSVWGAFRPGAGVGARGFAGPGDGEIFPLRCLWPGRMGPWTRGGFRVERGFLPRGGGRGVRVRLARGGGLRKGKVPGDGAERRDDQVDQTGQQRGQPTPAAVGGDVPGEFFETLGEPLLGGVGGWGDGVHIALLEFLTSVVKRDFRGAAIHGAESRTWDTRARRCLSRSFCVMAATRRIRPI